MDDSATPGDVSGPAFEPTEEQRRVARAMAGFGLPHADIAVLLDVDGETLREHFMRELKLGEAEGAAKVAQTLFMLATRDKNVSACIFWAKSRMGWSEKTGVEITGKDGAPLEAGPFVVHFVGADEGKPRGSERKAPVLLG